MLEAFHQHAFKPKPKPQRHLLRRARGWHWCVLPTPTAAETVRHRYRAEM